MIVVSDTSGISNLQTIGYAAYPFWVKMLVAFLMFLLLRLLVD